MPFYQILFLPLHLRELQSVFHFVVSILSMLKLDFDRLTHIYLYICIYIYTHNIDIHIYIYCCNIFIYIIYNKVNPKIYNTHLASNLFCAATSESQVLASLEAKLKESKDKPAVAFAVSEQYKSNTGEDAEENLDENGCIVDLGSKATKKNGHLVPKKRKKKN